MKPRVLVITGYGINCEEETAKCFNWANADAEIVHINDIINGNKKITNYQIMAFPGGFAYGDDTGSGNALANKIRNNLQHDVLKFAKEDKLIIGICNGMQMLANLGLIPATDLKYQIVFKYVKEDGSPANNEYPFNPNGAMEDIAAVSDPSGRIFALMPHPERFNSFTNEDGWELKKEKLIREGKKIPVKGDGLKIFENAVKYFS